ncbi:MAG: archease [Solirubrobacterales bacterium]
MYHLDERDSEIEMTIDGGEPEGVFADALLALGDVFSDAAAASGRPVTHEVQLKAGDVAGLFSAWIGELVELAEAQGFVPERVEKLNLEGTSLVALVAGERGIDQDLIKAVASHRTEMGVLEDATWSASIVLDLGR